MNLRNNLSLAVLVALSLFSVKVYSVEIEAGEPASLQCVLKASLEKIKWYKDGEELNTDDTKKFQKIEANNTLVLLTPDYTDGGNYTCSALIEGKTVNQSIEVLAPAHVKKFERSKNLVQGDNLVLDCDAQGYPQPSVYWLKGDVPVNSLDDSRITFEENKGIENATLLIKDLKFEDRAEYMCVATNDLGSHNNTILVRVKDKLAALWPFLAICAEVTILCIIIFIYERRRAKKLEEEEMNDTAAHDMSNSNDHKGKDEVRQRK